MILPGKVVLKILLLPFLITQFLLFFSCGSGVENKSIRQTKPLQERELLSGKQLSLKYCQSCHLYPEPASLDKHTWERSVLPLMGRLFGFYEINFPRQKIIEGAISKKEVEAQKIFPHQQIIREEEWRRIIDFYLSEAPDALPSIQRADSEFRPLEAFELLIPTVKSEGKLISLLKIHPENSHLYVGESKGKKGFLTILNKEFEIVDTLSLSSPPTDIYFGKHEMVLTLAGTLRLAPAHNAFGELVFITGSPEEKHSFLGKSLKNLNRPVQTLFEDVNGDGLIDLLTLEFGYYTGALSLYLQAGENTNSYKKKVLKKVPGAVRAYVQDMNGNGHRDVISLFAQGDEGISIFYNKGMGEFQEDRILRFPPTYGSVYFELMDFNKDGHLDILYCNGDNGDYPPILKPYHGIRIFENDGSNNFELVYFFPMYGANKSSAADFDLDGDLDIVAISYYPDTRALEHQDFVFLKNNGNYNFAAQFLQESMPGKWFTFDIGDLDANGYPDVLLGAFGSYQDIPNQINGDVKESVPILFLKNKGK